MITGGNSGIGYETAKVLAGNTEARIYIWARNRQKSIEAIEKIKLEVAEKHLKDVGDRLQFIQIDLSDLNSIEPAVKEFCNVNNDWTSFIIMLVLWNLHWIRKLNRIIKWS